MCEFLNRVHMGLLDKVDLNMTEMVVMKVLNKAILADYH
ncbi:hypothetical protein XNC1_2045 [Xenorhabdus nematophila ATCC 19061]|uniref:Uncharacterized protein n=1 Tax=Xenorhabdus nematophila (strain ATCC 19061 / DSM 3370 / CCUG 14189 / LMG 1036 / NCIMB 9965 / AN6) TaxID=406817 RepID=D3VEJ3_XENNA|nr:hypothetical protein XNC1_2045 [Xenorhabdus nematophila ATCC 19061]